MGASACGSGSDSISVPAPRLDAGSVQPEPGRAGNIFTGYETVLPVNSLKDVASFSVQFSIFKVVGETFSSPPDPGMPGYVSRTVQVETLKTPWVADGYRPAPVSNFVNGGYPAAPDGSGTLADDARALRVGETYAGAIAFYNSAYVPLPGAVWVVQDGVVQRNPLAPRFNQAVAGWTSDELAAAVQATKPHPSVVPYLGIKDAVRRYRAAAGADSPGDR